MSQDIRIYEGTDEVRMKLRALMGKDGDRNITINIGREKVRLTERQALDLVSVITKRIKCTEKSFQATGYGDTKLVKPNGHIELEDEDL